MAAESTQEIMEAYWAGDLSRLADDAVFTVMGTDEEAQGREAIGQLLRTYYDTAFDADTVTRNIVFTDEHALLEADFTGRHIGEFRGLAASGKEIRVPLCVSYDLAGGFVTRARIYFETDALRRQIDLA
jgi:ketosteroid isomerase-like protein